jgi:hypothetical protein
MVVSVALQNVDNLKDSQSFVLTQRIQNLRKFHIAKKRARD